MTKMKHFWAVLIVAMVVLAGQVNAALVDRTGSFEIAYSSAIGSNENGERVFDNTTETKWLTNHEVAAWIQFDFSEDDAFVIDGYTITSANDAPDRTPKDWTLQGSNDDGANWDVLDTRTDMTGWSTFEKRSYTFTNTTAYKMYKLDVTANNGTGDLTGFSEMELLDGDIDRTSLPGDVSGSSEIGIKESTFAVFDGTDQTKWLTSGGNTTGWIQFEFSDGLAYSVSGYSITSANDAPDRTPKDWTLQGSNDGVNWTIVDTRVDEAGWSTFEKRSYSFTNIAAYSIYKLDVTANNGDGGLMGFSEFELLGDDVPTVIAMTPGNFQATSATPLVLTWDSILDMSSAITYTMNFGTDSDFTGVDTITESGLTAKEWTVPEASITDDSTYYWRVDIVDDPNGTGTETFVGTPFKFRVYRQVEKVLEWSMDSLGAGTLYSYENPVQHVTATASSIEQSNRNAGNTTGPGLAIDPSIPDPNGLTHSNNAGEMWICNPDQEGTVWIQYDFDQPYQLGTMMVWNHNVGEPWLSELNRGMRDVIVSYSMDETNWTTLGNYTIPMGTGLAGMLPSIEIDFGGTEAQYVRITAAATNSNWGADRNFHALSEVRFGQYNQPVISYVMPDTSGNGNDAITYVDPQLVTEAITGSAIDLSGNDMVYMEHTDPNAVETLPLGTDEDCYDSWSMNFYVLQPEKSNDLDFFVGFGDFEKGTGRYIAQFAEGIHFWGGANVDSNIEPDVDFDLNRWQMITTTYESQTLRIYKNAEEIYNDVLPLGVAIPTVSISGMSPWGASEIVGKVDEFTIFKGRLSQAEIDALEALMPTQYSALNPVPTDGMTQSAIDPILGWDAPLDAIDPTYTVYLGTDENSLPAIASGLTETELDILDIIPLGLNYGTTYYWYVDTSTGDISDTWSFTTMPASSMSERALGWDFENLTEYPPAYEQAIEDIAITASSQEAAHRGFDRAANGIGIFVDPYVPDANGIGIQHSNDPDHMWICDPDQSGDVWIKFGFDQSYALGTMMVWNHNVGEPYTSELDRGMRNVKVMYTDVDSTDPNDWTSLGSFEIPQGTGLDRMPPSIGIDFGGIEAQYVMILADHTSVDPTSNWGADRNFHALSEVRFGIYGTTAPANVVVPDTAGNGNVGILYGTPEIIGGLASGQCVKIEPDSIDAYYDHIDAEISDAAALPLGAADPWSINYYINLYSDPGSPTLFTGFGGTPTGSGRFVGRFNGVHFWGGDNIDVASNPSRQYRYGHWQMVTATYSGSELKLYYNGEQVGSGSPSNFVDAEERVTIAGWNPWGRHMNGLVDNFEIYRGVLTRAEIAALAEVVPMEGDMNWDGTVDVSDLPDFALDWLTLGDCTSPSDLTGDCDVTLDDFAVVAENWLKVQ